METTTVLTIAVPVVVVLAAIVLFAGSRRRDAAVLSRETVRSDRSASPFLDQPDDAPGGKAYERAAVAERQRSRELVPAGAPAPPAPHVPPDPETIGVTRRQFFNRGIVAMMLISISGFGGAMLAFLWPQLTEGFGTRIRVGNADDLISTMRETREPVYMPEGRFYLNPFPTGAADSAAAAYTPPVAEGMAAGFVALFQTCPHLGCRVPWCETSQWFECPCHGSQYNRAGEWKRGPAPRGMDRFPVTVEGGVVFVDTGNLSQGPPLGTNTTGQEAEGPHCIDQGVAH